MTVLLMGENSYEIHHHLRQLEDQFEGAIEKFDGTELELRQLPDILTGTSLFSQQRLVIIRNLSFNKSLWDRLPEWLDRISDDVQLVLVEVKPDKRTKTYKALQKSANVLEYKPWSERDDAQAAKWIMTEAEARTLALTPALARLLVARVGVDQWQLTQALDKLLAAGEVTEDVITNVIDARPSENVFDLLETALKGDVNRLRELLAALSATEDPYMLFGLLSGQAFQLMALALARDEQDVANDFGVHPYALSRMRPYARQRGSAGTREVLLAFNQADEAIKTSYVDPWTVIEQVLFTVAAPSKINPPS